MGILIFIGLIFVIIVFPVVRYCVFHPVKCLKQGFKDMWGYFHYKKYNLCPFFGQIYMFVADGVHAFGSGKTLSMVEWLTSVYEKYNGLEVFDEEKQEFTIQHVIIISNVKLNGIPYIPFTAKDQFINIDKIPHSSMDILLFAIDEAGAEFNSREYKSNLPTDFLVRLLQVRHNKVGFVMTSQRFTFVDKLLRNVTGLVCTCRKVWRIVQLNYYDGFTLENAQNSELVRPIKTRFYFATDKLYNSYDTLYNVEKLKQQLESGDLLDTSEILERIKSDGDLQQVSNKIKKRYKAKK